MPVVKKIGLDVDGVLAKFLPSVLRLHGLEPDEIYLRWNELAAEGPRPWDVATVIGCSKNEFWKPIHEAGHQFWVDLELFDYAKDLYAACLEIAPVKLLTSPSLDPFSHSGKAAWIQKHFGRDFRDYLIGPPKDFCAGPGVVLIDDSPAGCQAFAGEGGWPILFPSIGNEKHWVAPDDVVEHVLTELRELHAR